MAFCCGQSFSFVFSYSTLVPLLNVLMLSVFPCLGNQGLSSQGPYGERAEGTRGQRLPQSQGLQCPCVHTNSYSLHVLPRWARRLKPGHCVPLPGPSTHSSAHRNRFPALWRRLVTDWHGPSTSTGSAEDRRRDQDMGVFTASHVQAKLQWTVFAGWLSCPLSGPFLCFTPGTQYIQRPAKDTSNV